jgi:DNA polymerase I-like protein with 3'-5' exonuclease and polymerase domains
LAKAQTFTLLFGGGPTLLQDYASRQGSQIDMDATIKLCMRFFDTFKGLASMKSRAVNISHSPGPVVIRLPNGLRRILVGANKKLTTILNTTVQGTAAVGLKYGLLEANKRGLIGTYMGATVHDEVVSTVPKSESTEYGLDLADAMTIGMTRVLPNGVVRTKISKGDWWQE